MGEWFMTEISPEQVREFVFMAMAQHEAGCNQCAETSLAMRRDGSVPERSAWCSDMLEMIVSLAGERS